MATSVRLRPSRPAPPEPPPRRRTSTARTAVAVVSGVLAAGALLNAESLDETARSQPFGWRRTLAVRLAGPVADVARATGLTAPRRWLEDLTHRPHPGSAGAAPVPTTTTTAAPGPVPPEGTTTTTAPVAPPEAGPRRPTPEDPLRLWVGGDSMSQTFGESLLDLAARTGVVTASLDARVSTGLSRPDYFDWPGHVVGLAARLHPEAVVFLAGANDAQPLLAAGQPARFGSPEWRAEYRTRVAGMMDTLGRDGRLVYWIGLPVMRSDTFSDKVRVIDDIAMAEAAAHQAVRFVDGWTLLADASGHYRAYLTGDEGAPVRLRQADGVHLTRAGADLLARATLDLIGRDWPLPGS